MTFLNICINSFETHKKPSILSCCFTIKYDTNSDNMVDELLKVNAIVVIIFTKMDGFHLNNKTYKCMSSIK